MHPVVCPGLNESADRVKSAHTRHGNAHLNAALGVAAMSAARTTNTHLATRYRRIATRRGSVRAVVAIERTILTAVWNMRVGGTLYSDLGGDCHTKRAPMRANNNAIHQLESLGYQVTVQPAPA